MLTGRESLIRLIGKRRRILPNRESILLTNLDEISLHRSSNGGEEGSSAGHGTNLHGALEITKHVDDEMRNLDLVNCPVCGNTVLGADHIINSHLDACLERGTRRKLTQRTLLQFSFCSQTTEKINSGESNNLEANETDRVLGDNHAQDIIQVLPEFGTVEDNDKNQCLLSLLSKSNFETFEEVSPDILTGEEIANVKNVVTSSFLPNIMMSKVHVGSPTDDLSLTSLDTFIVGRRFGDEVELKQGDRISLLRDSTNVKDPNAIKVLLMYSDCEKMLGFLPRDLARYLSPLIDKYCLSFEGSVMSLPKHSLDIVPIQIVPQELTSFDEKEYNNHQVFKSLWKDVLHVVECAKDFPPSMTKYQQNFCLLMQEVMKNHHHLFTDDEKHFIESFSSLSDDSQRVFIRLYTRKGPWFRMSNISYPEISDSQEAIEGLCATGYLFSLKSMKELHDYDIKEVLEMLTVSELREILSLTHFKLQKGIHCTRKQELIASILASYGDGMCPPLTNMVLNRTETCVRISSTAEFLLWRVQRLFFLNGEQDLSAFLMVDLGLVKYPVYNCVVSKRIFPSRSELLAYEEAIEVAQIMDQSLDENNTDMVIRCIEISDGRICGFGEVTDSFSSKSLETLLPFFSASWVYSKVVMLGVSYFEREHRYVDAIRLLKGLLSRIICDGRRGYWTLRLSVDLEHISHLNESLSVAEEGLLDPWVRAGSKLALQRRVLRLGKPPRRWKIPSFSESVKRKIKEVHVLGRPLNCDLGMKNRFYDEDGEQCGVEQLALQYYAREGGGWQGVHTESGVWMTIFGIVMWDVIFADIPDVFHTRFQTSPLDLETDNFYIARKSIIESQLQKIHGGMAEEILITSWETHVGTACRGVNWYRHSLSDLRAAVTCVGGPCLASLCRLLAHDYKSWSSGMPDLLLWRFIGEYTGEAKLVEVKGPRDRLSEQQRAWLLLLMDCGFNTEVCKVSPVPRSE